MGSGLILFVIVGAWLAVLVPMGLRSHDDAAPSRSVERFSDAMRVLSRRTGQPVDGDPAGAAADLDAPEHVELGHEDLGHAVPGRLRGGALRVLDAAGGARATLSAHLPQHLPALPSLRRRPGRAVSSAAAGRPAAAVRTGTTRVGAPVPGGGSVRVAGPGRSRTAVRRRRVLIALGVLAAAGLVAALVVPTALLLTALCGLLSVAFVVHCRRQARSRAAWLRNRAAVEAELSGRPVRRPEPARGTQAPRRTAAPAAARQAAPAAAGRTRTAPAARVEQVLAAARLDEEPAAARSEQFFDLAAYERSTVVAATVSTDQFFDLAAYERSSVAAPAARTVARTPVRAALGAEWQPVPVPLPTYVGKQTAPARSARPSALREQRQAHEGVLDDPGELQREVVERDRAAAGW